MINIAGSIFFFFFYINLNIYCASTVELEAAGRRAGGGEEGPWEFTLWSLHLKDPACVGGAQTQVLVTWPAEQVDSLDDHDRLNFPRWPAFFPCSLYSSTAAEDTKVEAISFFYFSRLQTQRLPVRERETCKKRNTVSHERGKPYK